MNPTQGEETIFAEALCLPPEERAVYLAQATSGRLARPVSETALGWNEETPSVFSGWLAETKNGKDGSQGNDVRLVFGFDTRLSTASVPFVLRRASFLQAFCPGG